MHIYTRINKTQQYIKLRELKSPYITVISFPPTNVSQAQRGGGTTSCLASPPSLAYSHVTETSKTKGHHALLKIIREWNAMYTYC